MAAQKLLAVVALMEMVSALQARDFRLETEGLLAGPHEVDVVLRGRFIRREVGAHRRMGRRRCAGEPQDQLAQRLLRGGGPHSSQGQDDRPRPPEI